MIGVLWLLLDRLLLAPIERATIERWGMVRFTLTAVIFVLMLSLPAKMFLRLVFNVK